MYKEIFNITKDEIVILDLDGTIVDANQAWKSFCEENGGDSDSYYIGSNYLTICGAADGSSSAEASVVVRGLTALLRDGGTFRCEYPCHSPTVERWFELTAATGEAAGKSYAVVTHRNISTRYVQQRAAKDAYFQAEMLATLVANSNDAILSYDLDGRIESWNLAAERLYGYTASEAIGQRLDILYPPDWPIPLSEYRDRIISGEITSFEAVRVAKNGTRLDVWITGSAVRGHDGAIEAIANIHRDVTERKRLEEAQTLIAQEVTHRAKNMLAVVNAIQRQTARRSSDIDEFTTKFGSRISSLVSSTDLLVAGQWTQVRLDELIKAQLNLFEAAPSEQISFEGQAIELRSQAAQALGMAFHELLTNATKYGALSHADGRVSINWTVGGSPSTPALTVAWMETGVSFSSDPTRQGFGHTVLTKLTRAMIEGQSSLQFDEAGLAWSVIVPSRHFVSAVH